MIESIVSLAARKIGELLVKEARFLYSVEDHFRSLQEELTMMNSFLNDMEALEDEGCDERTHTMIRQIRNIAYEAEDVVESYVLQVNNSSSSSASKGAEDLIKRYVCFCSSLSRTHQVGSKIEAIKERICEIMERWEKYKGGISARRDCGVQLWRPIAYSHTNEDHVVGLDKDIDKLVKLLTMDKTQTRVLSIVGMGGSGKTTLARKLYNHPSVRKHFECVAWVSISKQWVTQQILLDLLRKASGDAIRVDDETWSIQLLGEKLHQHIKSTRYLIVLDDVWTNQALEEILPALPLQNNGAKIIVTTQIKNVVDFPDLKCWFHEPKGLSEEESWDLFRKIALNHTSKGDTNLLDIDALEELAKNMLKKCEGLPLAVVALAGLLRKKKTIEEWEKVRKVVSAEIMDVGRGTHEYGTVKRMLELSYNDLPYQLKPCFLYLALFPEGFQIPTGMLIRLWIAEGFITSDQLCRGETLEDMARNYIDELVHRYVVQITSTNYEGKVKSVQIHDLTRDLCMSKAKEQDFLEILSSLSLKQDTKITSSRRTMIHIHDNDEALREFARRNYQGKVKRIQIHDLMKDFCIKKTMEQSFLKILSLRSNNLLSTVKRSHLTTVHSSYKSNMYFPVPTKDVHLRSLLFLNLAYLFKKHPKLSFESVHKHFRLLRVLDMDGIETSNGTLPTEIGSLIHLRYLGIRYTTIYQLPSSIGNLCNLLTLDFRYSNVQLGKNLIIPDVLWEIESLRHLYLPFDKHLKKRLKLSTLRCLQTLWGIGGGNWILEEVPNISESVRKLHIRGLENSKQLEAAFCCPSIVSDRLHTLYLDWVTRDDDDDDDEEDAFVPSLEPIIHCHHLRKLELEGIIDDTLTKIQFSSGIKKLSLTFTQLNGEAGLTTLGELPNLMLLNLLCNSYTGIKWTCIAGEFSKLKELCLSNLPNIEECSIQSGAMPQLRKLTIRQLKRLSRIPQGLEFITTLQELVLLGMNAEFYSRTRGETHVIQHIPVVRCS